MFLCITLKNSHVEFCKDGKLWLNSRNGLTPLPELRTMCYIGKSSWSDNLNKDILLDDIRVYNRVLSEAEIQALNNQSRMMQNLDLISKIAQACDGKAELIFYYAGHGLPDEQTKEPLLIPVDVNGTDLSFAVKMADVYRKLTENPSKRVTAFIDACFSGGVSGSKGAAKGGVGWQQLGGVYLQLLR
ncbi:LamG-like jellyroll fold domain-containing protein [Williamwhitmania taraxaci]|uniref:LamG-like jellyroll fold domain-containing protein n=1 Tax=Williamwhitmania taraxaci TaxID=1640674 RepID=UPI000F7AD5B9|nr:LamG-like jellyroll fold domain-containing protein [Williamwhitmania taraxaci]